VYLSYYGLFADTQILTHAHIIMQLVCVLVDLKLTRCSSSSCCCCCRLLVAGGPHPALRVPGGHHGRTVLLLLLLPAQHAGAVHRGGRGQPPQEPPVGHGEPASVRGRGGRPRGGPGRRRPAAAHPVPHEQASRRLNSSWVSPPGSLLPSFSLLGSLRLWSPSAAPLL